MISAIRKVFTNLIDEVEYSSEVDAIGRAFIHRFTFKRDRTIKFLQSSVVRALLSTYKKQGTQNLLRGVNLEKLCIQVYDQVYTEDNFRSKYKGRPTQITITRPGRNLTIEYAAGEYINRKNLRGPIQQGNYPFHIQAVRALYGEAMKMLGIKLGAEISGSTTTLRQKNQVTQKVTQTSHRGLSAHGSLKPLGGSVDRGTTVARLGALSRFEGSDYNDFPAYENIDKRLEDAIADLGVENKVGYASREFFDKVSTEYKRIFKTKYDIKDLKRYDNNQINRQFVVDVEYADSFFNRKMRQYDADGMKQYINKYNSKIIDNLITKFSDPRFGLTDADLQGSKSFKQGAQDVVPAKVANILLEKIKKGKNIKVKNFTKLRKTNKKSSTTIKGKDQTKGKKKTEKRQKNVTVPALGATAVSKIRQKTRQSNVSLPSLMVQINKRLPTYLLRNMKQPRLVYRTGRLAQSIRALSIQPGRRGLNIDYTYMKNPYQTFEPGFQQGSDERDPRELAEISIRQILIDMQQSRFLNFRRV